VGVVAHLIDVVQIIRIDNPDKTPSQLNGKGVYQIAFLHEHDEGNIETYENNLILKK
jgi:hypothetical protein